MESKKKYVEIMAGGALPIRKGKTQNRRENAFESFAKRHSQKGSREPRKEKKKRREKKRVTLLFLLSRAEEGCEPASRKKRVALSWKANPFSILISKRRHKNIKGGKSPKIAAEQHWLGGKKRTSRRRGL